MPMAAAIVVMLSSLPFWLLGHSPSKYDSCCAELKTTSIRGRVAFPGSAQYDDSVRSYTSVNAQLHPTCILQPLSTEDISIAIKSLTASNCPIAVRSGGHASSIGASNISPGVTIDLSLLNRTTYNPLTTTASIQTGARWSSVYETLQHHNVMVPGGRSASVGVGGYLLGGGISFHASRVGLSCDSIQRYEIVLASGEIIHVTRRSHPDLFKALKGGSNNFGIVSTFEMSTFPEQDIWGGFVVSDLSALPQYTSATTRFTNSIPNNPNAALASFLIYNSTMGQSFILSSLAYTESVGVGRPAAFEDFYPFSNIMDTLGRTNMLNLTTANELPAGYRNAWQTSTHLNREDIIQQAANIQSEKIALAKSSTKGKDFSLFIIIQPWVPQFWKDSAAHGGNVLGLERFSGNMLNIAWLWSWDDEADDTLFYSLAESARKELDDYSKVIGANNEYIYINYAGGGQNPLRGYGAENLEFLRRVSKKYDPDGVFQRLVRGGFKLWEA
ncbi:hypothetical protein BJY04DRAFT_226442 [Aspergillus karnatakaensis]|uniref:uncharacterized protein n=1 Tax=Aspergillus karnatakaensis TaxID=1810916 RepID=UPI003CCD3745